MARWLIAILAALSLSACGGGDNSTSSSTSSNTPTTTTTATNTTPTPNTVAVTLDAGPSALGSGNSSFNTPFVTITICAPGSTSNCQTIDHIILDTGSVGLRVVAGALDTNLLAALPKQTSRSGNPVAECYQYVNSYAFGTVRLGDFSIAGEKVASMPLQIIGDPFTFAPSSCSSGGGTAITTVQDFGANGIMGVGTTTTDCGSYCTVDGGSSGAIYYDCPTSGCSSIIARAANASAPFEQLPNPVAAFPVDNNGIILTLPSVAQPGVTSLTGTVMFGISTQADNMLAASNVLPLTTSTSQLGAAMMTATYKGQQLTQSFLDSGSNSYFFIDTSLTACRSSGLSAYYCPSTPQSLSPVLTSYSGATASAAFTLYNPQNLAPSVTVAPGLGVNPARVTPPLPFSNSFDFGIPFFFGRTVYTAIEGRATGSISGPYVAF